MTTSALSTAWARGAADPDVLEERTPHVPAEIGVGEGQILVLAIVPFPPGATVWNRLCCGGEAGQIDVSGLEFEELRGLVRNNSVYDLIR